MSHEIPDAQAGFRKGRGIRDQIANIRWIGEKAREFQRITRGGKKIILSEQCKKIEGNDRMEKTRDLFKNIRMVKTRDLFKEIRDREGMFQAKMGTIKERNGMDLTEAEDTKR